jgi:hypothetical protein
VFTSERPLSLRIVPGRFLLIDNLLWDIKINYLGHAFPALIIPGAKFDRPSSNFSMRYWFNGNVNVLYLPWKEFISMIWWADRCNGLGKGESLKSRTVEGCILLILDDFDVASFKSIGTCVLDRKDNIIGRTAGLEAVKK